jgi:ketosteroid isomerase-like protein
MRRIGIEGIEVRFMTVAAALILAAVSAGPTLAVPEQKSDAEAILERYTAAYNNRDAEALGLLYAVDAVLLPSDSPLVRGLAAIKKFLGTEMQGPARAARRLRLRLVEKGVGDRIAYLVGSYSFDGRTRGGMFTFCLKRNERGGWLIAADMRNASEFGYQPLRRP